MGENEKTGGETASDESVLRDVEATGTETDEAETDADDESDAQED